jgi:hypothetical protein
MAGMKFPRYWRIFQSQPAGLGRSILQALTPAQLTGVTLGGTFCKMRGI